MCANLILNIIAALAAIVLAAIPAHAADEMYPNRAIRIVMPYGSGPTFAPMRIIAAALQEELGQPVVLEERSGAAGRIGAVAVKNGPTDGYTLGYGGPNLISAGFQPDKMGYEPVKDFEFIGFAGELAPPVLLVRADYKGDFTGLIEATGSEHNWGANLGTTPWLAGHQLWSLVKSEGKRPVYVSYKAENTVAQELLVGSLESAVLSISTARGLVLGGKIRALAVLLNERSTLLPNIPALPELGIKDFNDLRARSALYVRKGTSKTIVRKLRVALTKVMSDSVVQKKLEEVATVPLSGGSEEVAKWIRTEDGHREKIINRLELPRQ